MSISSKILVLGGILTGGLALAGCGPTNQPTGQSSSSLLPSESSPTNPSTNFNDNYLGSNLDKGQIDTQQGLAQPLAPLPDDTQQAIDSEDNSIGQDLYSLENTNSDDQALGL